MEVQSCQFVSATNLVPRGWDHWFWEAISVSAPFTWGDNNRSMVTASSFADHCEETIIGTIPMPTYRRFINKVRSLGEMYIDLES